MFGLQKTIMCLINLNEIFFLVKTALGDMGQIVKLKLKHLLFHLKLGQNLKWKLTTICL